MEEVSVSRVESTRKICARLQSDILQRLAQVTQARAADCMGVSASTISRQKEDLEHFCLLLAALGYQLAPVDAVVVSQEDMKALERMAYKYLQARIEAGVQ